MKKIIALAVASAFVTPVMAADITISGDVEFKYYKQKDDGIQQSLDGDSDFFITASEELGGGNSVKFVVGFEDVANPGSSTTTAAADNRVGDAELHISGAFGTVQLGNVDIAANQVDEYSHVAEDGGAVAIVAGSTTNNNSSIAWVLPSFVDGLTVIASQTIENGSTANSDDEKSHSSFAVKYSTGALAATYSSTDIDGAAYTPTQVGVSYTMGPIFVAMEQVNEMGAATTDATTYGITYNYGAGKVFAEMNQKDAAGTKTDTDVIGASYKLGAVNLYVQNLSSSTDTNDVSTVGVEYSF